MLEWCTNSKNTIHAFSLGLLKGMKGEKHPMAKLTKFKVLKIRSLKGQYTYFQLAKKYKVSYQLIGQIMLNKIWKN